MARRTIRRRCSHTGCTEWTFSEVNSLREAREIPATWTCVRHRDADRVLTPTSPKREVTVTAKTVEGAPGLYWKGPNQSSGVMFSPGLYAAANDFVEGTRIRITYEVLPPALVGEQDD